LQGMTSMARPAKVQVKESQQTKAELAAEVDALRKRVLELEDSQISQQKNETQFRSILENSTHGILIHRHLKPLFANQALAGLYGYGSPEEILALASTETLFSPTHTDIRVHESRLMGEDIPRDSEIRGSRKDGSELWVEKHSFVIDWDGEPAVCSLRFDITEQARTEQFLKSAMEAIPHGFALYDENDTLALINKNFFKYRPELKKIMTPGIMFEEQLLHREKNGLLHGQVEGRNISADERRERHKAPIGPYLWSSLDGQTLQIDEFKTSDGGMAIIRTDISKLIEVETALRESEERYRLFAGDVAHQLRTPLAILRAHLESAKAAEGIKSLISDVDEMARLINQLLAYAQLDSLKITPSDQADLCEICTDVAAFIAPLAIQEGRSIEVLGGR
jgi:PAS domain S-box-containing protein